jgi:uncharacterized membrane protein (UPF0127 family)
VRYLNVRNLTRRVTMADAAGEANSFWLRLRGLLGRPPLQSGQALLLSPCKGVHMFAMRYPIDVAFLDEERRVIGMSHRLAPGARSPWHRTARYALELPAGTLRKTGTENGDQMVFANPTSISE